MARNWRIQPAEVVVFIPGAQPMRRSWLPLAAARAPWLAVALLLPRLVVAQTDLPFERLGDQVNAGDHVRIVDATGRVRVGDVAALTPDYIALARAGGANERIAASDVREVQVRRRDGPRKGTLIGFGSVAAARRFGGDAGGV